MLFNFYKYNDNRFDEHTLLLLHGEEFADSSIYEVPLANHGVTVTTAQSKFGGKSLYFDGSKYMTAYVPINGDMTVECWIYIQSVSADWPTPFDYIDGVDNIGNYFHTRALETCYRVQSQSNLQQSDGHPPLPLHQWIHLAIVRHGTDTLFFENGILKYTQKNSSILKNDYISIGRFYNDIPTTYFNGYIDELRISDVARWTNDFVPPSEPYSNIVPKYDVHTMLLLHGEEIKDSSMYEVPLTNNGVVVATAQSKFGRKSLYFNGSSKILITLNNMLSIINSNFTIDWWEYRRNDGVSFMLNNLDVYGYSHLMYRLGGDSIFSSYHGGAWDAINALVIPEVTHTWQHQAVVRLQNHLNFYLNGQLQSSRTLSNQFTGGNNTISIGDYQHTTDGLNGYIDEFRISNVARWTSNFTPPTKPYHS